MQTRFGSFWLMLLTTISLLCFSSASFASNYEPISNGGDYSIGAELELDNGDGRYAMVSSLLLKINASKQSYPYTVERYAIDCANLGVQALSISLNTEADASRKPNWVTSLRYQNFDFKELSYVSSDEFEKQRFEESSQGLGNEKKESLRKRMANHASPSESALVLSFGCEVLKGASPKVAAKKVYESGGLQDIKLVSCSMVTDGEIKPLELTVRFSESKNMVQVQNVWELERSVTDDKISAVHNGLDLSINRRTGRGQFRSREGISFDGPCQAIDPNTKKF